MNKASHLTLLPITAMLLFWALTPISIAWIKNDFSLIFQIWLRYVISTTALWLFLLTGKSLRNNLYVFMKTRGYFLRRLSVTAFCTIMFQLLFTWCFFLIPPGFGILLYQSQVIFSVILGVLFFKTERQLIKQPGTAVGILVALIGAALVIIFQNHGFSVILNTGILLALGGALSWSFVGLTVKKWIGTKLTPLFTVTIVFTLVSIFLTPPLLFSGSHITGNPSIIKWSILIGSGLLGIAGGQGLYYYLLPYLGVITASSVQLLVPFFTGIFSFLLFGERITLLQLTGGLLLLGGCRIVLLQKDKLLRKSDAASP
ncbi:DMT family transporter [Desulfopila sp. IMCC35008]|uniref:DMT family transporter n=1 Tax=Desulfopila sp. IMCC35008 TaxID=2653858 RepID=UPI0013D59825|nr:DMT family transporter [Desulfopila sp. IMCC35008]